MNWVKALREELSSRARAWAEMHKLPYYESLGAEPVVLFKAAAGNFQAEAWQAITATADWAHRLNKTHSQKRALPEAHRETAKELDSCNSSDALLMNCFCFPGASTAILGGAPENTSPPIFGFMAGVSLADGRADTTEIDMYSGGVLVEAKLTEANFTMKSESDVRRYANLEAHFDVSALPREGDLISGYQLIRNVLAAAQHNARLVVLLDARRPDLLQEWWRVHSSIREASLRMRCSFRMWQEVAAESPLALRNFLQEKYGL